jgi:hypothetical protein
MIQFSIFFPADIDECLIDPCGSGECINKMGSYTCVCHEGFQFDNQTCQDINECNEGVPCSDGICENTVGSFICSSKPGYYLENNTCFGGVFHSFKIKKFDVLISIDVHITLIILVFYLQMSTSAPIRLASTAHASINRAPICVSASQDLRWREMFA